MRAERTSRYALLGLLLDAPHHGYELYQSLSDPAGLGQVWHLGMSQMYAELKVLEAQGWVKSAVELQDARPSKKVFTIATTGRKAFHEWMATPARGMREMRIAFIVRYFFAQREGIISISELIHRQKDSLRQELQDLEHTDTLASSPSDFEKTVASFRVNQIKAALVWLESVRVSGFSTRKSLQRRKVNSK